MIKVKLNFRRVHKYLTKKIVLYRRWYQWPHHKLVHYLIVSLLFVGLVVGISLRAEYVRASGSTWTQSDWSGGVGSSTTNQYSSESNLTASSGNLTLVQGSNLITNGNFTSNLSGWNGGILPNQISGMDLWLNAGTITGVTNGNPISSWSDASGNSNNFSQSNNAYQPIYETNVLNGQPAVQFTPNEELTQS